MMDDSLLRQRRNLILVSVLICGIELSGADIGKISLAGLNFDSAAVKRPEVIYYLIWVIWFWFFTRFMQYFTFEAGNDIRDYKVRWLGALLLDRADSQYRYSKLVKLALNSLSEAGRFGNTVETYKQIKLCIEPLGEDKYPEAEVDKKFRIFFVERINEGNELAESIVFINEPEYKLLLNKSWFYAFVRSPLGTEYYAPIIIGLIPILALIFNRLSS